VRIYLHSPNTPSRRGAQLKQRDKFTTTTTNANAYGRAVFEEESTVLNMTSPNTFYEFGKRFLRETRIRFHYFFIREESKGEF
jgi:hypothetical protein